MALREEEVEGMENLLGEENEEGRFWENEELLKELKFVLGRWVLKVLVGLWVLKVFRWVLKVFLWVLKAGWVLKVLVLGVLKVLGLGLLKLRLVLKLLVAPMLCLAEFTNLFLLKADPVMAPDALSRVSFALASARSSASSS